MPDSSNGFVMQLQNILVDRSAVLLLGVSVGAAIGFSFLGHAGSERAPVTAPACRAPILAPTASQTPEVLAARQCAAPAQRQLMRTLEQGAPVRVAVFGDSYGDGVWSGLQRQLS